MPKKTNSDPILDDSASLWLYLKEQGGLDTKSYDQELQRDLRSSLSLPNKGPLDSLLRSTGIPVETFLFAFFKAIQPYAQMMADLLRMFEKAGATQANNNLAIRFDFGQKLPELSFDLTHFRQWNEVWSRVAGVFLANVWDYQTIWALNKVVRTMQRQVGNSFARDWLREYYELKAWPKARLQPPNTGVRELDQVIERAWRVWTTVVSESAKYGDKREDLRRERNRRDERPENEERSEGDRRLWTPEFLARIDSDMWAGSFAAGAYDHAERISRLSPEEQRSAAKELIDAFRAVFDQVREEEFQGETLVRRLEDFLKLPIWKRRHELYSTWVGSQILDASEEYGVRIHHVKGRLLISFSGTHLGTLTCARPTMHIWAELRSPLQHPIGKGRKRSIQPDYSLLGEPVTSPEMSILEVECKQYKIPSAKNFCAALTDYATGRPNARVILVSYGRADEALLAGVHASVRDRTNIIGQMRPSSADAQARFCEIVRRTLAERCERIDEQRTTMMRLRTDAPARITLSWGSAPRDLDLHARIVGPQTDSQVDFSDPGNTLQAPWVQLDADIRHGQGPETIAIDRWIGGATYHVAVHNYSEEIPIAGCGAFVVVTQGSLTRRLECPSDGSGRWWSVIVVHSSSGEVEIINKIVDTPW